MGFNPTFYAGRPKLSEITIDSDLDMGGRKILHAQLGSPHVPETWATEELDWGDVAPSEPVTRTFTFSKTGQNDYDIFTHVGDGRFYDITIQTTSGPMFEADGIYVNDVRVYPYSRNPITVRLPVNNDGDVVSIRGSTAGTTHISVTYTNTGLRAGAKTFNLTGKWLALGIDMKGLAATVKIQGVEIPYSDYAKYFPLAPTELTFPGDWDASPIRPVVEVYV